MNSSRADLVAIDKRRVWHPYTEMGSYISETDPIVVARARGPRLFDVDGRSYLDANSSWWVSTLGHNHPRLVAALARQAETLCHCALAGITHPEAALLADELCRVAPPGLERVFFSDNGSTSVEVAIKMALQFAEQNGAPRRRRFVAMEGAFHGETLGAASLGGVEVFRRSFSDVLFDCIRVPWPADGEAYGRAFEALERALAGSPDEIAAVVLEPCLQGAAGMRVYPAEFLRHARALCDRHEILLVFDEVFTGYGRTGPMWASSAAAVSPDLLCLAKGFSGGMLPMAATLATERIFRGFIGERDRAFYYGHTYCGNPLGAAVAREVLRVYEDEKILENAAPKSRAIGEAFAAMGALPHVARPRALGMVGAIDLEGHDASSGYLSRAGWHVFEAARRRGVYLRPLGNVVYVAPPLNIPDADLSELLGKVREAIEEVAGSFSSSSRAVGDAVARNHGELPRSRPQVAPADLRRSRRPGARSRTLANAIAQRPRRARLPLHRRARRRQDDERAHPRQGAQLLSQRRPDRPTSVPASVRRRAREIAAGIDVDVQEIDGASYNGVDEVRRLQESLPYRPARDRYKIFIVDEVHMLSQSAWNAFLKTLEEPPPHVKFIFATTEVHKVPVTILIALPALRLQADPDPADRRAPQRTCSRRRRSRPTTPRSRSSRARPRAACATR